MTANTMQIHDEPPETVAPLTKALTALGESHQREFKRVSGKMVN